jgi:hypothetical protein
MLELARHVLKRALKKMYARLQSPQCDWLSPISYHYVKRVFDLTDLYVGNRTKKQAPRRRSRYEADYANTHASNSLKEIVSMCPCPFVIWTDTGRKVQGAFDNVPHELKIIGNPQPDGKCQRFLPTIEPARAD